MKSLMKFEHVNATSLDDAISILREYGNKAWVLAGGTDLVGTMRFEVLQDYPEILVNLKTIPGLDYIKEEKGILKIGALTRLEDIAFDDDDHKGSLVHYPKTVNCCCPHCGGCLHEFQYRLYDLRLDFCLA